MKLPRPQKTIFKNVIIFFNDICQKPFVQHLFIPLITTIPLALLVFTIKDINGGFEFLGFDIRNTHDKAFLIATVLILIAVINYICTLLKKYAEKQEINSEDYLIALIQVLDKVVEEKVNRFKNCLQDTSIQQKSEIFEKITQPENQLRYLNDAILGVFQQIIPNKEINVSLLEVENQTPKRMLFWKPEHPAPTTSIEKLSNPNSTAMHCITNKKITIVENTEKEIKKPHNKKYVSNSSTDVEEKSILCYPVFDEVNLEVAYVINIVVNGSKSISLEHKDLYKYVLQKIVTRMELEHILKLLKERTDG
ncbi:hypothetical protein [Thiomicrospira sp. XS5]|uniref:hypothetical protein n=1 Tax=Thiomicrospira sp. XS5 TaxID=1775636 RepID=UPI00128F8CE6|nr:hypothetical protein [Thiomicrospira sp. XS5]